MTTTLRAAKESYAHGYLSARDSRTAFSHVLILGILLLLLASNLSMFPPVGTSKAAGSSLSQQIPALARLAPQCTNCVLRNITVGSGPDFLLYDPLDGNIFVPNTGSSNVTIINGTSNKVVANSVVNPDDGSAAVDTANGDVYVTSGTSNYIAILNGSTGAVIGNVSVGNGTGGIGFDPISRLLFVTTNVSVASIGVIVNTTTNKVVGSFQGGIQSWGVLYNPFNHYIYVSATQSPTAAVPGNVTILNGSTGKSVASVTTGLSSNDMAVDPVNGNVYVANPNGNDVTVIDGSNFTVLATLAAGTYPRAATYDPITREVYVGNLQSPYVTVIDPSVNKVVGSIPTGTSYSVQGIATDTTTGLLYASNILSNTVTVIQATNLNLPAITSFAPSNASFDKGLGVYLNVSVVGGTLPYSYSYSNLPSGCVSANSSSLYCVPTVNGTFVVGVTVVDSNGSKVSASTSFTVNPPLAVSGLTFSPGSIALHNSTQVSVQTSGGTPPLSYSYTGLPSGCVPGTGSLWVCTPTSTGNFSVTVTVTDGDGVAHTATGTLIVQGPANPLLATLYFDSSNYGPAPLTVTVTGTSSGGYPGYNYSWAFGNGTSGVGLTVSHTYTAPGNYSIVLTVTDSRGDTASATGFVTVKPVVSNQFSAQVLFESPNLGSAPLSVTVSANVSGGTAPFGYQWSFGDGATSTSPTVTHTYTTMPSGCKASRCTYNVTLVVSDAAAQVASARALVTLVAKSSSSLSVTLAASVSTGVAPLATLFSATPSGGRSPYTLVWTFGDGSSAVGPTASHVYAYAGTYTAIVTVVDANGSVTQAALPIVAYPAPPSNQSGALELSISAVPATGMAPLNVAFQSQVVGGTAPYTYSWNFGDGTTSTNGSSVLHTYPVPGEYVATLVVSDGSVSATTGVFVTVYGPGAPSSSGSPLTAFVTMVSLQGSAPTSLTFFPSVYGGSAPYQLRWNFGDGSPLDTVSTALPVTHTYAKAGTYYPSLQVTDARGNVTTWSSQSLSPPAPVKVKATGTGSTTNGLIEYVLPLVVVVVVIVVVVVLLARKKQPPSPSGNSGGQSIPRTPPPVGDNGAGRPSPPSPPRIDDPLRDVFRSVIPPYAPFHRGE